MWMILCADIVLDAAKTKEDLLRTIEVSQNFDYVAIGACSARPNLTATQVVSDEDERDFAGKTVILLSRCCGQYDSELQDEIRQRFAQVNWIIPNKIEDFCGAPSFMDVAEELIRQGIIKEVSPAA